MRYDVIEQHRYAPNCALIKGGASWDNSVDVVALKWQTPRGWSRPAGELDRASMIQAIELAVRESVITPLQAIEAVAAGMKTSGHQTGSPPG
jgi:hypothetical protein